MFDKKNVKNIYALTPVQEGMLFYALYDKTSLAYFEQVYYHISGKLSVNAFERAWNELVKRHDILRTIFVYKNVPQPLQIVLKERQLEIHFEDLQGISPEEQEAHCQQYRKTDQSLPFDLSKDVLMRFAVFQLGEASCNLIWSCHHILLDGWSVSRLYEEFFILYDAFLHEQTIHLPPSIPFSKYLTWLNKQNKQEAKEYWKNYLSHYHQLTSVPQISAKSELAVEKSLIPETFTFQMTREVTLGLKELASRNHVTLNTVFMTLWGILLSKYNEVDDIVFGAAVSGRPAEIEGIESIVGLFINTIPIRIKLTSGHTFRDLLQTVQKESAQGQNYHYTSLVDIMMDTSLQRNLFDHILIFENFPSLEGDQERANSPFVVDHFEKFELTSYDLSIQVFPDNELEFVIIYQPALYEREMIVRIEYHLSLIFEEILQDESLAVHTLNILSEDEKENYLQASRIVATDETLNRKTSTPYAAPENEDQEKLVSIWQESLKLERLGIDDNFFELGGHSLLATRIVSRIHKLLEVEVGLKEFFDHPNIRSLWKLIHQKEATEFTDIPALPKQQHYDVSHAQRRLWILEQMQEESTAYNMQGSIILEGNLNVPAFQKAFQSIVQRHESLRTTFISIEGEPKQTIHESLQLELNIMDLCGQQNPEERAREIVKQDESLPFDLEKGPLLRGILLKIADDKHVFVFNIHHIIGDGWSFGVLVQETFCLYEAFVKEEQSALPPLRIQYKDYAAWQNNLLLEQGTADHREYWLQKLSGELPVLELPLNYPRPPIMSYQGNSLPFALNLELTQPFQQLCQDNQASLFMGLLAVVKILLHRYTNQEDILVGSPIAGRNHPDLEGQIGFYVNTLVLRDQLKSHETFEEVLQKIRQTTMEAYDHQIYPFDKLVDELNAPRFTDRSPLFDVMVVLQNQEFNKMELKDIKMVPFVEGAATSRFDLTFNFMETDSALQATLDYRTDLFEIERIHQLWRHLDAIVKEVIEHPQQPIARLEFLTEIEKAQITESFNQTLAEFPDDQTLTQLFEQQVQQYPGSPAISMEDRILSYKKLNEKANALAHYLRNEAGLESGDIVAVMLERSEWSIIGLLGTLKAGGVYLPVEPSYPKTRIEYMLTDSQCKIVLSDSSSQQTEGLKDIPVLDITALSPVHENSNLVSTTKPEDLAYVIYTSGSTGTPKGVMVEHRGFINMSLDQIKVFGVLPTDRVLQFASPSFDASLSEIFMALLCGASLVLIKREVMYDLERFSAYLQQQQVTVITLPPSYLSTLKKRALSDVRVLITAGESAHVEDAIYYSKHLDYFNAYGPTECSVCVSYHRVSPENNYPNGIPVGKPIANTEVLIVDPQLNLVPVGVVGEICVSGVGLARGYLGQEELTQEKFIPHPLEAETRLYRTGDSGQWLEDGNILFIGRKDDQVKIRGYRIELGEINQRLLEHPRINDGVVMAQVNSLGAKELTAYVVSEQENWETQELKNFLSQTLPEYMIPVYFIQLDKLPLTPNGKIDKQALPHPQHQGLTQGTPYQAPRDLIESYLAEIWENILNQEKIGIYDNFFNLGGDSIKAIQILDRLQQKNLTTDMHCIFQHPSIAELSSLIRPYQVSIEQRPITGPVELTPIQHHFFAEHQIDSHHFNQALLLKTKQRFEENALLEVLQEIQKHHDMLRARYHFDAEQVVQVLQDVDMPLDFRVLDLKDRQEAVDLKNLEAEKIQAGMDLEKGSLMKVVLFRMPQDDQLLVVIHHLLVDGISWRILVEDIQHGYQQKMNGQSLQLPEKSHPYPDWAKALRAYASNEALLAEKSYWQQVMSCEQSGLTYDHAGHDLCVADMRTHSFQLTPDATESLLGQTQHVFQSEINDLLLTALAKAFQHWRGNQRTLIYLETHGRGEILKQINTNRTIGWFTSFYPFLLQLPANANLFDQVQSMKENLQKVPHKGIGFGVLKYLSALSPQEKEQYQGKARISFNYLGQFDQGRVNDMFEVTPESTGTWVSPRAEPLHDLYIEGMVLNQYLEMTVHYHPGQYEEARITALCQYYQEELDQLISFFRRA
ncbi:MAG: amino acid adenylation domain-containing protein [SAR324 cluster bacterium]|nr:amino acid adenylation domain-containing protein [SAR324 cluster bacterium]